MRGFGSTMGAGTTDVITGPLIADSGPVSFALWTYRNGDGGGNIGRMFDAGAPRILLNQSGSTAYDFNYQWSGGGGVWRATRPAAGVWVHVAVTYDPGAVGNDPLIYFDGISQTVTEPTAPLTAPVTGTTAISVGNRGAGDRVWDGMLGELGWWNRILTQQEIFELSVNRKSVLWFPDRMLFNLPSRWGMTRTVKAVGVPTLTGTRPANGPTIIYPPWFNQRAA